MAKQFTMVRGDDASVSVLVDSAMHRFNRPGLEAWVQFIDGISGQQMGSASVQLMHNIYLGRKPVLVRLLRQHPALAMQVAGEIAEMLTNEAKKATSK